MDNSSPPRVNGKYMSKYIGRTVMLVCEVISNNIVKSSDGLEIVVHLPTGTFFESKFAQIEGKVSQGGNVIEAFRVTAAGEVFDMENYNQAIELMNNKYEYLFV